MFARLIEKKKWKIFIIQKFRMFTYSEFQHCLIVETHTLSFFIDHPTLDTMSKCHYMFVVNVSSLRLQLLKIYETMAVCQIQPSYTFSYRSAFVCIVYTFLLPKYVLLSTEQFFCRINEIYRHLHRIRKQIVEYIYFFNSVKSDCCDSLKFNNSSAVVRFNYFFLLNVCRVSRDRQHRHCYAAKGTLLLFLLLLQRCHH